MIDAFDMPKLSILLPIVTLGLLRGGPAYISLAYQRSVSDLPDLAGLV